MQSQYASTCKLTGIRHEAAASGRADLRIGFAVACALHALAVVCTGSMLALRPANMVPSFQQGDSAVALTLIASPPSPPTSTPESMEPVLTRPGSDFKIDQDMPEVARKPEPSQETNDVDALTKGVESSLQPLVGIRPVYPLGSRIRGEEGVVTLKALVDGEGRAITVTVVDSSGYAALDNAAVEALQKTRFVSARKDGRADERETTVRIRFRLTD